MPDPSERFWDDLLLFLDEGKVIPVVGPELVTVLDGDQQVPLYGWLARRLAESVELPLADLPATFDLNDVVSLHQRNHRDRESLYREIFRILRSAPLSPDETMLALAGIPAFDLFVSLTFDSLLAQAIAQARPCMPAVEIAYSTCPEPDLPEKRAMREPVVFHLLGRASPSAGSFAICDADLLEFLHALQNKHRQPPKLFDALAANHLLILGCGFSDWLARFFLRTARGLDLSEKRKRWDVLADARPGSDPALAMFLSSYSSDTRLLTMPAAAFVKELAQRWQQAHPTQENKTPVRLPASDTRRPSTGAVFVSYASENRQAAQRLAEGLRAARLDVWFDQDTLQLADDWSREIQRGIDHCALFLPVISRESLREEEGRRFFWAEWNVADKMAENWRRDEKFIVPVAVDDPQLLEHTSLPETFRRKQGIFLRDGQVTSEFTERLIEIVQNYHRRRHRMT